MTPSEHTSFVFLDDAMIHVITVGYLRTSVRYHHYGLVDDRTPLMTTPIDVNSQSKVT